MASWSVNQPPLSEGEEVLVRGVAGAPEEQDKSYFGVVVEVDEEQMQCLVRFADCTERWSEFNHLRRLDVQEDVEQAQPNYEDNDSYQNNIYDDVDDEDPPDLGPPEVDVSSRLPRFPPNNLPPSVTPSVTPSVSSSSVAALDDCDDLDEDLEVFEEEFLISYGDDEEFEEDEVPLKALKKRRKKSYSNRPPKAKRAKITSKSVPIEVPQHVLDSRKELPYDFDSLVWDANHLRNESEKYCYCGESGDWYKKMLQCSTCLQWFHQECLRKSTTNLLFGDRFYHFDCALCSGDIGESLTRLGMNWVEATHLVLFNLTVINNKKYHDLESSVLPFFKRKFKCLQGPNSNLKSGRVDVELITDLLVKNKTKFKCGSEIKKRSTFWGLRKVAPPSIPSRFAHLMSSSSASSSTSSNSKSASSTVNYKCKLDTKRLKNNQKAQISMPKPDNSLLKKPPVAKKRGRPAKNQQKQSQQKLKINRGDSLDHSEHSDGADTNSSGRGTLDAYIPPPKDFEGFNNPFRDLGISTKTPPEPFEASQAAPPGLLMIHSDSASKSILENKDQTPNNHGEGTSSDLKADIKSYFGAFDRIARGERFSVAARRLNMDGDVQYLVEWEQPNPLSPISSPSSVKSALIISPSKSEEVKDNEKPEQALGGYVNVCKEPMKTIGANNVNVEEEEDDEKPLVIDLPSPKRSKVELNEPSQKSPSKKPFPVVIQLRSPTKPEEKRKLPSPNVAKKSASVTPAKNSSLTPNGDCKMNNKSVIEIIPIKRNILKIDLNEAKKSAVSSTASKNPGDNSKDTVDAAESNSPTKEMSLQDKIKEFKSSLERVKETLIARKSPDKVKVATKLDIKQRDEVKNVLKSTDIQAETVIKVQKVVEKSLEGLGKTVVATKPVILESRPSLKLLSTTIMSSSDTKEAGIGEMAETEGEKHKCQNPDSSKTGPDKNLVKNSATVSASKEVLFERNQDQAHQERCLAPKKASDQTQEKDLVLKRSSDQATSRAKASFAEKECALMKFCDQANQKASKILNKEDLVPKVASDHNQKELKYLSKDLAQRQASTFTTENDSEKSSGKHLEPKQETDHKMDSKSRDDLPSKDDTAQSKSTYYAVKLSCKEIYDKTKKDFQSLNRDLAAIPASDKTRSNVINTSSIKPAFTVMQAQKNDSNSKSSNSDLMPKQPSIEPSKKEEEGFFPTSKFYPQKASLCTSSGALTVIPVTTSILTLEKVPEELPDEILADVDTPEESPNKQEVENDDDDKKSAIVISKVKSIKDSPESPFKTKNDCVNTLTSKTEGDDVVKAVVKRLVNLAVKKVDDSTKIETKLTSNIGQKDNDAGKNKNDPKAGSSSKNKIDSKVKDEKKTENDEIAKLDENGSLEGKGKSVSTNGVMPRTTRTVAIAAASTATTTTATTPKATAAATKTSTVAVATAKTVKTTGPIVQPNKMTLLKVLQQQQHEALAAKTPVVVIQLQKTENKS